MKAKNLTQKWMSAALLALALSGWSGWAATATDIRPRPAAMQPDGDANDTTLNWGVWWTDSGVATEEFDTTMRSSNNIAGSIHVIMDAPGGTVTPVKSANLAYGNFLDAKWGNNTWLGAGYEFDASKYESLTMDLYINTAASSNTAIPFVLWGGGYENKALMSWPITNSGWQHIVIPISSSINLPNCTAYGVYNWYNTTASTPPAHVEYWFDNVKLVARQGPPPPPTLTVTPATQSGLMFDSGPGEGGQRGAIDTAATVYWSGLATPSSPVTYAMIISSAPDPTVYPNYQAHIFLAPHSGVGNPDWNEPDMGYLQILGNNDGTATARMMWKTNDAMNNAMLFNTEFGGTGGTNNTYAAGTLGYLRAPTMAGTWSISFTSDTDMIVRGPGGVSTNFSLPAEWVASFVAVNGGNTYAYFGSTPNNTTNAGQALYLSKVTVTGGLMEYSFTNDFSSTQVDTAIWGLLGNETFVIPRGPAWWVRWTQPATDFALYTTADLNKPIAWTLLSGNTNLPVPVTSYMWGTNTKVFVAAANLPSNRQTFFCLQKVVATKLQVLMPGETNAPGTTTGKVGTPLPQAPGVPVTVTVNAVDANWNLATSCRDTVHLTSSDTGAVMPADAALTAGTGSFLVIFGSPGTTQTITVSDVTNTAILSDTGSPTSITQ